MPDFFVQNETPQNFRLAMETLFVRLKEKNQSIKDRFKEIESQLPHTPAEIEITSEVINKAIMEDDAEKMLVIVRSGFDLTTLDANGLNLAQLCAIHNATLCMLVLAHCFVDINAASEANPVLPVHFSALNGHVDSLFLLNQYAATLIQTTRCLSPADFKNLMLDQSLIKRIKDRKLYLNRAAPATFAALAGHAEVLLLLACLCIDLNSNTCDKPSYVLTTSAPSKIRAYSYSEAQCLVVLIRSQALELENASARLRSRGDEELSRLEDGHAWATPFVSQTTYTVKLRVDMQDADGNTALHDAAKEGAVNQVAWLITQGANVNMQNNQGYTPIQVAAFYHELGALTCLLFMPGKFTPNLELQDGVNDTAVTFAVYDKTQDNPDCLSLLLEMKANPNPKNKKGITPLAYAAAHSSSPLFDALLSSGAVDLFGVDFSTSPVNFSIQNDSGDILTRLITMKQNIQVTDSGTQSGLMHLAAQYDAVKCLKILITHRANPHEKNTKKQSMFHVAAQFGADKVLSCLYEMNLRNQGDEKDSQGLRPIDLAAKFGQLKTLHGMLKRGVTPTQATTTAARNGPMNVMAQRGHCIHLLSVFAKEGRVDDISQECYKKESGVCIIA